MKDGKQIKEFKSITEAAIEIGTSKGNVSNCISGKIKSICGYQFVLKHGCETTLRTCLMCGEAFYSKGIGNRRCFKCDKYIARKNISGESFYKYCEP